LQNLDRGGRTGFRGVEGRGAAYGANYARGGYAGYGYGHGRGYRHWPDVAAAAAYADSGSYASSDDGCYYV